MPRSEALSYNMQKPLQIRQEIISRWKWRTSFTFKVYSVWQWQRWRANKRRVYWCYWPDAGRWSRIVWNHWHQLWSEDNLQWIQAGHKRCSWWWTELWLICPPLDRRTRHHSALSLILCGSTNLSNLVQHVTLVYSAVLTFIKVECSLFQGINVNVGAFVYWKLS